MELDLLGVLAWLGTNGGSIMAISWLWEFFNWFPNMSVINKKKVLFGFSAGVALASWAILMFVPSEILAMLSAPFLIVAGVFYNIFIGDSFHEKNKIEDKE